jgi:Transglutaminase-like superfamily
MASTGRDVDDRRALASLVAKVRFTDLPVIVRALAWSSFARVLMAFGGFNAAARRLRYESVQPVDCQPGKYPALSERTLRALRVAERVLERKSLRVTCLPRSIAVERTLRSHRVDADVVIGVMRSDGFKAHAWVEVNGYPVSEAGRNEWPAIARFRSRR